MAAIPGLKKKTAKRVMRPMGSGFKILNHTSDLGIRVWAKTQVQLFEEAAIAMLTILVEKPDEALGIEKKIRLEAESPGELLLLWLREILYLMENESVVYTQFQVESTNITEKDVSAYFLVANLGGFPSSKLRHEVCKEIKAVTRHGFYLRKNEPWWEASVLFDI
ncbi:MAG TPA: archease [bacterium]|nr:archease [bacterium]